MTQSFPAEAFPFRVRTERETDRRVVTDTWKRAEAECTAHREGRLFPSLQTRMMADVLARPGTSVRIASPLEDDSVSGWACIGAAAHERAPMVVYYVFVEPELRRRGIASLLLADIACATGVLYTAQPARICRDCGQSQCGNRVQHRSWVNSPIRPPKGWHYVPRAAFYPVMEAR